MHHFFLPPESIQNQTVTFPQETARQICSVLRLRAGQMVTVLDDRGNQFAVELIEVERGTVIGAVQAQQPAAGEPPLPVTLYLCLAQREKFEWMLQKCTEVGACEFVPVISSRSLVQDAEDVARKQERWERILREAAEQSHRGRVPRLRPALKFDAALEAAKNHALRLIPWEQEAGLSLRAAIRAHAGAGMPESMGVLIGPEGGFSEDEVEAARTAGFQAVTLGPRILRMETAAVVATALVIDEIEGKAI